MTTAAPVTMDDLRKCTMRRALHMRGSGFDLLLRTCVQHPRLQQRVHRVKKQTARHWLVDGEEFNSLDAALVRLNTPETELPT